ncbi:MAG TPA: hypothetical protein VEQ85_04500 [Lacipirellulaceae bacterium]|nr:hypothetical protein [Lacipirellulaceae bacterium]
MIVRSVAQPVSVSLVASLALALAGCERGATPEAPLSNPLLAPRTIQGTATAAPQQALSAALSEDAPRDGAAIAVTPTAAATGENLPPAGVAAPAAPPPFEPPFPDRVDLFVAPKRQGGAAAPGVTEGEVNLMGFVRVDRQRAILSINGEIASLCEGDALHGIEVISVHPPNVVLQRGRQRWQATLE